jgi:uncharacterized protein
MDLDSPTTEEIPQVVSPVAETPRRTSLTPVDAPVDIPMADAPSFVPSETKEATSVSTVTELGTPKHKSPELRVQLPPVPSFDGTTSAASSATTPLSSTGTVVHSPFSTTNLPSPFAPPAVNGVAAHPSPVKKKLSLSDYTKSRLNKTAGAKPAGTTLKPPSTVLEEAKSPTSCTDTTMVDSPVLEKAANVWDMIVPKQLEAMSACKDVFFVLYRGERMLAGI